MANINDYNFAGKKAIVRVDFNVPLNEKGEITDDTRIRGALPTLKKILADGGSLILMSHMGKPKGKVKPELSLGQIVDAVSAALGVKVAFAPDCAKASEAAAALKPGEALLLENLRFYPEEEGKPVGIDKADPAYDDAKKEMKAKQKEFAKTLASYADVYVNDAFGTAHRKHASTAVIADYFDADNKMVGFLMEKELNAVDNILNNIKRPFTAIMGGSKVSTKIGIIENLMEKVDNLILCGGMTYTFMKALGGTVGDLPSWGDAGLDFVASRQKEEKPLHLQRAEECASLLGVCRVCGGHCAWFWGYRHAAFAVRNLRSHRQQSASAALPVGQQRPCRPCGALRQLRLLQQRGVDKECACVCHGYCAFCRHFGAGMAWRPHLLQHHLPGGHAAGLRGPILVVECAFLR